MANQKISALTSYTNPDAVNDVLPIVDTANTTTKKISRNNLLGLSSAPVGLTDSQTLTNKILTAPTLASPVLSGTITGTYTLAGTPTFPASVVTLTGSQTLTNKILTSPTISTPTITNASLTTDAITGFSSANTGSIYGLAVTSSKISGTAITNSTVGPNQLATGAQAASVTTSEATTSTTYTALATPGPTVTVTIGANGLALVCIQAQTAINVAALYYASVVLSGANTVASTDTKAIEGASTTTTQFATTFLLTGLSPGSTTFTMQYRTNGNTATFANRLLSVIPL